MKNFDSVPKDFVFLPSLLLLDSPDYCFLRAIGGNFFYDAKTQKFIIHWVSIHYICFGNLRQSLLIPASIAKNGVEHIKNILMQYHSIELVFPMSQQVNYWLQFFGLYHTDTDYLDKAKPNLKGVNNNPPYYQAVKQRESPFLEICGKVYTLDTGQKLIPILHTKQYGNGNFNGHLLPYKCNYDNLAKLF